MSDFSIDDAFQRGPNLLNLAQLWEQHEMGLRCAREQRTLPPEYESFASDILALMKEARSRYMPSEHPAAFRENDHLGAVIVANEVAKAHHMSQRMKGTTNETDARQIFQGFIELFGAICVWCNAMMIQRKE